MEKKNVRVRVREREKEEDMRTCSRTWNDSWLKLSDFEIGIQILDC
jgi:hypothetical protein